MAFVGDVRGVRVTPVDGARHRTARPAAPSPEPTAATSCIKRCLDVVISVMGLLALIPFVLPLALLVRADSPGPIFFSQKRWGKDGCVITIWKLRTLRSECCDLEGRVQVLPGDPRVTRIGRWLRRYNVDELPQLLNVLRGEMSLVGPRCHPVAMTAAGLPYDRLVANYHDRHRVRPGLSGLAQIRGLRGPTTSASKARARIAADLRYIETYSLWLDLRILGRTLAQLRAGTGC